MANNQLLASDNFASGSLAAGWSAYTPASAQKSQIVLDPQVGDVFRLSVIDGSDGFPVLSLFQNGFLILQVQDQSSTPIETGNPGMQASSVLAIADAQISGWAGGNADVIPPYPPIGGGSGSWTQAFRDFVNKRGVRG